MPVGRDKVPIANKGVIVLTIVAIVLLLAGCGGEPLPSAPISTADAGVWMLTSPGEGRNLDLHPGVGERVVAETTIILTTPVTTYAQVSLTFWAREGSRTSLAPISTLVHASISVYNIYAAPGSPLASPFITDGPCSLTHERGKHVCDEGMVIPQGQNRFVLSAVIVGDGQPHVYTFGISEMHMCDSNHHCWSVNVSRALLYQGGGSGTRPADSELTTFTVRPQTR